MQSGMDSLAAIELRNNIQARFDIDVPATITFDHPNIEALANYINNRMSTPRAGSMYSAGTRPLAKHVRHKRHLTYDRVLNHFFNYQRM